MIINQTSIASVLNSPMQGIYNASKAASAMLNDTLRSELRPFGIRVIDLKTGLTETNFLENQMGTARLPRDSIYQIAEREVEEKLLGRDYTDGSINRDEYARQVVGELMKDNPPTRIWKGGKAREAWAASTFAPLVLQDRQLAYLGALEVVTEKVKKLEEQESDKRERSGNLQFCKHRNRRHILE